jgi:hypothetical protein
MPISFIYRYGVDSWRIAIAGTLVSLSFATAAPSVSIDRDHIQELYHAGELKSIETQISALLKRRPTLSKSDSIFAYKYQGVVLAADTLSKLLAKDYFYKLLTLAPDVDIIDMYVSEGIYALFTDVRREFLARSKYVQSKTSIEAGIGKNKSENEVDTLVQPVKPRTASLPQRVQKPDNSSKQWLYWSLGGTVVSGALVGLYFMSQEQEPPKRTKLSNGPANP